MRKHRGKARWGQHEKTLPASQGVALGRNETCGWFDLGFPASRTMREECLVKALPACVLCWGSPSWLKYKAALSSRPGCLLTPRATGGAWDAGQHKEEGQGAPIQHSPQNLFCLQWVPGQAYLCQEYKGLKGCQERSAWGVLWLGTD